MTHDVSISPNQKIVFPVMCVCCEQENPDSVVELSFVEANLPSLIEMGSFALGNTYHDASPSHTIKGVPACRECAKRLKSHHRWLKGISYLSWSLGVILAIVLPLSIWWKIGVLILFLILPGIISVIYPPAFDATITKDKITFHFLSQKFADEMIRVNHLQSEDS